MRENVRPAADDGMPEVVRTYMALEILQDATPAETRSMRIDASKQCIVWGPRQPGRRDLPLVFKHLSVHARVLALRVVRSRTPVRLGMPAFGSCLRFTLNGKGAAG